MKRQIVIWKFVKENFKKDIPVMLLYVLESSGSSPGRQGFFMAVNANKEMEGSIGGGIMEHKFVEMAKEKLQVASYKLQEGEIRKQIHDKAAGKNQSGMICSGEQTIFLYHISKKDIEPIDKLISSLEKNKNGTLHLANEGILFDDEAPSKDFEFNLKTEEDWAYTEKTGYKNHLYIIGGGHCAFAFSKLMSTMDFYIHLFEDRLQLNTVQKNNYAHDKLIVKDYSELKELLNISQEKIKELENEKSKELKKMKVNTAKTIDEKINNKENENKNNNLPDGNLNQNLNLNLEIQDLKNLLRETQEQALEDHTQGANALTEMNRKFDNLMHNYEINVTAVSDKMDASEDQKQQTADTITDQNNIIKSLEKKLRSKSDIIRDLTEEVRVERTGNRTEKEQNQKLSELKIVMRDQLKEIRGEQTKFRESSAQLGTFFESEFRVLKNVLSEVIQKSLHQIARTHESNVQTVRSSIISNHENDVQKIESNYNDKIKSLSEEFSIKETLLRQEILSLSLSATTNTSANIDSSSQGHSPQRESKKEKESRRDQGQGGVPGQGSQGIIPGGGVGGSSGSDLEDKDTHGHGSLNTSILSNDESTRAYESVMIGLLNALEHNNILSNTEIIELQLLASENKQPCFIAVNTANGLLGDKLNKLLNKMKKYKNDNNNLKNELDFEISESQKDKERDHDFSVKERRNSAGLVPVDFSEINSVSTSSRAFSSAVGELAQSRHEQNLLLGNLI